MKLTGYRLATESDVKVGVEMVTVDTEAETVTPIKIFAVDQKVRFVEDGNEASWAWLGAFLRPAGRFLRMVPA